MTFQRPGIERDPRTSREFIHEGSTSGQRQHWAEQTAPDAPRPGEGLDDHAARVFAQGFVQANPGMVSIARQAVQQMQQPGQQPAAPPPPLPAMTGREVVTVYREVRESLRLPPAEAAQLEQLIRQLEG